MKAVYENIESGSFGEGSTDPDDYFQALAWHPYTNGFNAEAFVTANQSLYDIAYSYEGKHKTVYFTELGNWDATQGADKRRSTSRRYTRRRRKVCRSWSQFIITVRLTTFWTTIVRAAYSVIPTRTGRIWSRGPAGGQTPDLPNPARMPISRPLEGTAVWNC